MLKIDYRLTGSGWAECTIHADGRECEMSASYLSDALGKLVLAGVAVLAGAQSVSVGFDEEPGEYRWAIVMADSGVVRVEILEFQELWGNRPDAEGSARRYAPRPKKCTDSMDWQATRNDGANMTSLSLSSIC